MSIESVGTSQGSIQNFSELAISVAALPDDTGEEVPLHVPSCHGRRRNPLLLTDADLDAPGACRERVGSAAGGKSSALLGALTLNGGSAAVQ